MTVTVLREETALEEIIRSNKTSVVIFAASWSPQSNHMLEVLKETQAKMTSQHIGFYCVEDAETVPKTCMNFKVVAVPTVIFFRNNAVIDRVEGTHSEELISKIAIHNEKMSNGSGASEVKPQQDSTANLHARLDALMSKEPIMIFMKGNPDAPRCGFSRTIIEIMRETGLPFGTFDILEDEEVRQGLKEYVNWPTYPQVYVKGELAGGLDVIKQLKESGELLSTLRGE